MALSAQQIESMATRFAFLSDSTRLEILFQLLTGDRSFVEIREATEIDDCSLARQLKELRQAGVISQNPQSSVTTYRLTDLFALRVVSVLASSHARTPSFTPVEDRSAALG